MEQDFDTGTHLSCIFLYVTVVLWHHKTLYLKSTIGIMAHLVQDREEWLVNRAGFYPSYALSGDGDANFSDHYIRQSLPFPGCCFLRELIRPTLKKLRIYQTLTIPIL
jgi:hypothetical protein